MKLIILRTAILCVAVASTTTTAVAFSPAAVASVASSNAINRRRDNNSRGPTTTTLGMVGYGTQQGTRVDVSNEYAPRDIYPMQDWAAQYGVQMAEGVQ